MLAIFLLASFLTTQMVSSQTTKSPTGILVRGYLRDQDAKVYKFRHDMGRPGTQLYNSIHSAFNKWASDALEGYLPLGKYFRIFGSGKNEQFTTITFEVWFPNDGLNSYGCVPFHDYAIIRKKLSDYRSLGIYGFHLMFEKSYNMFYAPKDMTKTWKQDRRLKVTAKVTDNQGNPLGRKSISLDDIKAELHKHVSGAFKNMIDLHKVELDPDSGDLTADMDLKVKYNYGGITYPSQCMDLVAIAKVFYNLKLTANDGKYHLEKIEIA